MKRRDFFSALAGTAASQLIAAKAGAVPPERTLATRIETVLGPVEAAKLGTTLVHEHVLVDFAGAAVASRDRYDADEVFRIVLPHLQELRKRGCRTLVECTPAYLARDAVLLRRLSIASELQILTNTGYYGAAGDIAVPAHARSESARQLADRWTTEARDGIEGTGIRPAFVKSGVDAGSLSAIDRKLVEAAALCHLDTGLTLAIHTGDAEAARGILEVLAAAGVSPSAWIWVHAQNASDRQDQMQAAERGAWLGFDGVSPRTLEAHVTAVIELRRLGFLEQVLVSQDAGWYHVGEPRGGGFRSYAYLFETFVPALRARGLRDADIRTLLVENPARAFAPRVRRPR